MNLGGDKWMDPYYIQKHCKILNYTPNFELKRNKSTDEELYHITGTIYTPEETPLKSKAKI